MAVMLLCLWRTVRTTPTCAFLPMTNCSFPRVITECLETDKTRSKGNFHFSSLLFPANSSGKFVAKQSLRPSLPATQEVKKLLSQQRHDAQFLQMLPFNRSVFSIDAIESVITSPEATMFIYLFMLRKTYLYRQRIAALLKFH